jgi:hypothetical protein
MFDTKLNLEGIAVRAGYMLADAVFFNVTWAYACALMTQSAPEEEAT